MHGVLQLKSQKLGNEQVNRTFEILCGARGSASVSSETPIGVITCDLQNVLQETFLRLTVFI